MANKIANKISGKKNNNLDERDIMILRLLQQNADVSLATISKKINLSRTPCWKRIQKLKQQNYILKTVAILNPEKFGLTTRVLVLIETAGHNKDWLKDFSAKINSIPKVTRFYRLAGVSDYFLEVLLPDIRAYDIFYRNLLEAKNVTKVTSMFVIEELKEVRDLEV